MARFTKKPTRKSLTSRSTKSQTYGRKPISSSPKKSAGYGTQSPKAPARRPVAGAPSRGGYRRPGAQSGIGLWMKVVRALYIKYTTAFIIGFVVLGLLLLAGAFFLFFWEDGKPTFIQAKVETSTPSGLTEADDPYASTYTAEELAGLEGSSLDLTSEEYAGILDEENRVFIGVTIGQPSAYESILIQKLEEAINEEYNNGSVGDCIPYNSDGDINQQIQDVRSLVNKEAKAIIVCATETDEYTTITDMATNAGIAVVAVNAPVDYGYDINIVTDDTDFGDANAIFMGNNLGKGNVVQFVDMSDDAGNQNRLEAFNTKIGEFSNVNILATVDLSDGKSVSGAYEDVKEEGTIEGIYTENGLALKVLNECIKREALPKVFIGDATAGFIKRWYELMATGIEIDKKVDPEDDDSETYKQLVEGSGMQVFVRPTPYGTAATAVKFAIRLAEGKTLKTDMLTENKVYYYTGSTAIIDSVLPYYYEMVKDKEDDFVINDWPSDYEVDQYFYDSGTSYYDRSPLITAAMRAEEAAAEAAEITAANADAAADTGDADNADDAGGTADTGDEDAADGDAADGDSASDGDEPTE